MARSQKGIERAIAAKKKEIARIKAHRKAIQVAKRKKRQLQTLTNQLHRMRHPKR